MNMASVKTDLYQGHDYYMMDDLLTEEHKLIRDAAPRLDQARGQSDH